MVVVVEAVAAASAVARVEACAATEVDRVIDAVEVGVVSDKGTPWTSKADEYSRLTRKLAILVLVEEGRSEGVEAEVVSSPLRSLSRQ